MLVSIIIPTKNSSATLEACLASIRDQSYPNIEIIVVDNHSSDDTQKIAKSFTNHVYTKGPERSPQRNYGASVSNGEIVLIIDSDMELNKNVVSECVAVFEKDSNVVGLVIPEESFGIGFWAQCKKLERSFYVGVPWMEAARAFLKNVYVTQGGYDESMVSGEDWDLSQRVEKVGRLSRIDSFIMHNEGNLKLIDFGVYANKQNDSINSQNQTNVFERYKMFLSKPTKLLKNPILGIGMLFMKTSEFAAGAYGVMRSRLSS